MKKNKKRWVIAATVAVLLILNACGGQSRYDRVTVLASWSYGYGDVAGLTRNSDLIAHVSIGQPEKSYVVSGIRMTIFPATVEEAIYGEGEKEIRIVMTGGIDENEKKIYEIPDDPLMKEGEEYLIFARKNEDGTYTILGGPQGRFALEDGKVYSLNVINGQAQSASIQVDGVEKTDFLEEISNAIQ